MRLRKRSIEALETKFDDFNVGSIFRKLIYSLQLNLRFFDKEAAQKFLSGTSDHCRSSKALSKD